MSTPNTDELPYWFRIQGLNTMDEVAKYIKELQLQVEELHKCMNKKDTLNTLKIFKAAFKAY